MRILCRIHDPALLGVIWLISVPVFCRLYLKSDKVTEDDYVNHFGNNSTDLSWSSVRNVHASGGEQLLRNFCAQAHKMAGKGSIKVNSILLRPRRLAFKNENYTQRRVDVLAYGIQGITHPEYDKNYWYMVEGDHSYITQGKKPDCVYYLCLLNSFTMKFSLVKHVCGIEVRLSTPQS